MRLKSASTLAFLFRQLCEKVRWRSAFESKSFEICFLRLNNPTIFAFRCLDSARSSLSAPYSLHSANPISILFVVGSQRRSHGFPFFFSASKAKWTEMYNFMTFLLIFIAIFAESRISIKFKYNSRSLFRSFFSCAKLLPPVLWLRHQLRFHLSSFSWSEYFQYLNLIGVMDLNFSASSLPPSGSLSSSAHLTNSHFGGTEKEDETKPVPYQLMEILI